METEIVDEIRLRKILVLINGFLINDLVAPTSCIVLISCRLEYIDNLIELFITRNVMNIKIKIEGINQKEIFFMFLLIYSIRFLSYTISST